MILEKKKNPFDKKTTDKWNYNGYKTEVWDKKKRKFLLPKFPNTLLQNCNSNVFFDLLSYFNVKSWNSVFVFLFLFILQQF